MLETWALLPPLLSHLRGGTGEDMVRMEGTSLQEMATASQCVPPLFCQAAPLRSSLQTDM